MVLTVLPPPISSSDPMLILADAVRFCADVWTAIVDATDLWGYYFSAIIGLLLLRFILVPIFGHQVSLGGSSDLASRHVTKQLRAAQKEESLE